MAAQTAEPDPHIVRGVFLFVGAIYGLFTAIGIALLVYFNRPNTRAIFLQNAPIQLNPPNTSTGRLRPTAIAIIGWTLVISGPFCTINALLPLPAFLFGFTLYGVAGHLTYVMFGLISVAIGYGLLRLRPEARIAIIAWLGLGFLNMLAILTPWGSRNFQLYMDKFAPHNPAFPAPNPFSPTGLIIVFLVFGAAFNVFLLWLLHRHRTSFTPSPPPPPMPFHPNLLEG
jgi:hypothetical protein